MPGASEAPIQLDPEAIVGQAITSRRSIRAFLPAPIPRETVGRILDLAARAPSGTNMQPWRVHALAGEALARFTEAVQAAFLSGTKELREYEYNPSPFFEPYLSRRREIGWKLYSLLRIGRGESEKMRAQHARNFTFFDAPVGFLCTIHRPAGSISKASWWRERGRGLDTCPQAAFAQYPRTIRHSLHLLQDEVVVCGMALGFGDPEAPENALRTSRVPARKFATFAGFGA